MESLQFPYLTTTAFFNLQQPSCSQKGHKTTGVRPFQVMHPLGFMVPLDYSWLWESCRNCNFIKLFSSFFPPWKPLLHRALLISLYLMVIFPKITSPVLLCHNPAQDSALVSLKHISTPDITLDTCLFISPQLSVNSTTVKHQLRHQIQTPFVLSYPKCNPPKHPVKSVRTNLQPRSNLPFHSCEVQWYQFLKQHVAAIPRQSQDPQGDDRLKVGTRVFTRVCIFKICIKQSFYFEVLGDSHIVVKNNTAISTQW